MLRVRGNDLKQISGRKFGATLHVLMMKRKTGSRASSSRSVVFFYAFIVMFLNVFSVCMCDTVLFPTWGEGSKGSASYSLKGSSMGLRGPQVFLVSCMSQCAVREQ